MIVMGGFSIAGLNMNTQEFAALFLGSFWFDLPGNGG